MANEPHRKNLRFLQHSRLNYGLMQAWKSSQVFLKTYMRWLDRHPSIGTIETNNWTREDGAVMIMYTFKSMAALNEFVRHPDHQAVMLRAKEFFTSVRTQIATIDKQSETILES